LTTVAVIGDSQAQGLVFYGNISDELAAQGLQFVGGYQQGGATTRQILSRLDELLGRTIPDVVIVTAGGNETVGTAQAQAWGELVSRLLAGGVRQVFWISPPASPEPVRDRGRAAVSEAQRPVVEAAGATWISGRVTADGIARRDEVHLTNAGYREWARRVVRNIAPAIRGGSYLPWIVALAGVAAAYYLRQYRAPILIVTAATAAIIYRRERLAPTKATELSRSS
jgi:lysophospholipase L1-like esterase